jgi:hypothetical protein
LVLEVKVLELLGGAAVEIRGSVGVGAKASEVTACDPGGCAMAVGAE